MRFNGRTAYASPGHAFNPFRPLLRSSANAPEGTIAVSDVVAAVKKDPAGATASYQGKTLTFEGVASSLSRIGNRYYLYFRTSAGHDAFNRDAAYVVLDDDVGGALAGFKRGEKIRFKGTVTNAQVKTSEETNVLDGGTSRIARVDLSFRMEILICERTPL